jgi:hypothetical protein
MSFCEPLLSFYHFGSFLLKLVDRYDSQGIFSAPRALFMFRAFGHSNSSVLNGGLPAWEAEGLSVVPVQEDTTTSTNAKYPAPSYDISIIKGSFNTFQYNLKSAIANVFF